mmetsp:Transcript_7935/g.10612  ORF Transcript_7935/g.10612 Transcript_7935/m.10612 type:complete len:109 (-) Transcript_7935:535-861(-)
MSLQSNSFLAFTNLCHIVYFIHYISSVVYCLLIHVKFDSATLRDYHLIAAEHPLAVSIFLTIEDCYMRRRLINATSPSSLWMVRLSAHKLPREIIRRNFLTATIYLIK